MEFQCSLPAARSTSSVPSHVQSTHSTRQQAPARLQGDRTDRLLPCPSAFKRSPPQPPLASPTSATRATLATWQRGACSGPERRGRRRRMAPLSQQAAEAAYLGAPVRKKFRQGWFNGAVTEVSIDLEDDDGVKWPLLFQITCARLRAVVRGARQVPAPTSPVPGDQRTACPCLQILRRGAGRHPSEGAAQDHD